MSSLSALITVYVLVSLFDIYLACQSFKQGGYKGLCMGFACVGATMATVFYGASFFAKDYVLYSVLTSLFGISVNTSLLSTYVFTWYFTNGSVHMKLPPVLHAVGMYNVIDTITLLINPSYELAMSFEATGLPVKCFHSELLLFGMLHRVYEVILVAVIALLLLRKIIKAPMIYAKEYIYCLLSIFLVAAVYSQFVINPDIINSRYGDYVILGHTLTVFAFYWNGFSFSTHGLINYFQGWIFENIDQAIVLFNYEDRQIMHNKIAESMLPAAVLKNEMELEHFILACGLDPKREPSANDLSFRCYVNSTPMRCDYTVQYDDKDKLLGRMFVFRKTASDYDVLTGFSEWTYFKTHADELFPQGRRQQIVVACDINSLTEINRLYTYEVGDRCIQFLAEQMRSSFPEGTEFVRTHEATVAAICEGAELSDIEAIVAQLHEKLKNNNVIDGPIILQSSVSIRGKESIVDTIRGNMQSIRTKKLMDKTSVHSEILLSLMQALNQCDPDTSAHVQRTQSTGKALGRRIGLTDQEQSNLALLAILHDIGKIGIPHEILNKPGKLSEAEWKMMKTHVEKGYQIAKNSQELSGIADMILYHHERWDGRGYPECLSGNDIPLLSRVISVVDTYDAMTHDRIYRKALSESAARSELRRCAGSQFDPLIVREFLEMLEDQDREQGISLTTMSQQEAENTVEGEQTETEVCENVHFMAHSVYVLDSMLRIIRTDDGFEKITGYTRDDIECLGLTQSDLIFEEDRKEYFSLISTRPEGVSEMYLEHRLRRKDGSAIMVYCYGHEYYDPAESDVHTSIVIINSEDPLGKKYFERP